MHSKSFIISLLLCAAILLVFWQVQNHDFINFDDPLYISDNIHVKSGLNRGSFIWAFSTTHAANWHPLTWLSHMLDCQLYGLKPGGHHLTNVLFHMANAVLLFLVLYRMTSGLWPSALVAALFALHPLHVESVAWVAERKDVLSTFFWILTMWMYVRYAEQPGRTRYLLALLVFALGLMTKPMLVTLPFVLLLLDYWPLQRMPAHQPEDGTTAPIRAVRIHRSSLFALLWEKTPFFMLAAVSSLITFFVQKSSGAMPSLEIHPVKVRIANALLAYVSYIGQMIWPQGLTVFYPHPGSDLPLWQILGAGLLLLCLSIAVIRAARHHPYLPVGWLWYLGTLVPVIGLVQVGTQARADRYTYVPLVGLFIMVAWGFPKLLATWRQRRAIVTAAACIVLAAMMIMTWSQVRHWKNSVTLFRHALTVTSDNHMAHNNLGAGLGDQGKMDEAIYHYYKALEIKPNYGLVHLNLGAYYAGLGDVEKAIHHCSEALRVKPNSPDAHSYLGLALAHQGKLDEAIEHYREALEINPQLASAHLYLGLALKRQGKLDEAISHYSEALRCKPDYFDAHLNLATALAEQGNIDAATDHFEMALRLKPNDARIHDKFATVLIQQGRLDEAIAHFSEALRIQPDDADTHYNLGVTLEKQGRLDEAMIHFSEVLRLRPDNAEAHNNMGVILASQGRFKEAISHYSKALQYNPNDGEIHNNLGVAFFSRGQLDQAIGHYLTAIKLDPSFAKAHNNLGNALVQKGKLDKAIVHYSRALEIQASYPEAHNNLGVALAQQGKLLEAISEFEKALRLKPDYAQARTNLGNALDMVNESRDKSSLSSTL